MNIGKLLLENTAATAAACTRAADPRTNASFCWRVGETAKTAVAAETSVALMIRSTQQARTAVCGVNAHAKPQDLTDMFVAVHIDKHTGG